MNSRALISLVGMLVAGGMCLGAEYPPADHAGEDLTLADGDVIWGLHANVGAFVVPLGATVLVKPYDGSNRIDEMNNTSTGTLIVQAFSIRIDGTLTAEGAGYSGGGGGGGGGMINQPGGDGGNGRYQFRLFNSSTHGQSGMRRSCGICPDQSQPGGDGAPGDGIYYGSYLQASSGNWQRACGGYRAFGANADATTDESLEIGSGGAGGPGTGGYQTQWSGWGGASGGSGGGLVSLQALNSIEISPFGIVIADGVMGNPLDSSVPYCCSIPGYPGENTLPPDPTNSVNQTYWYASGGAGAGGGIMLKCTAYGGLNIAEGAEISTLGGGDLVVNGGTVKLFFRGPAGSTDNIFAGRLFFGESGGASAAVGWENYE